MSALIVCNLVTYLVQPILIPYELVFVTCLEDNTLLQ